MLGKLKGFSQHGMASQIHHDHSQSGSAKAHLDRSEEMLAKEAEAHEEAEAAAIHCDHMMSEGQNSRLVHRFFVFLDFESTSF